MTRRYYGTLYLVTPGEQLDPERMYEDVVETYPDGTSHIDVARELWSLAGDGARAAAIHEVVLRGRGRDSKKLHADDLEQLLGLLAGLDDALTRTIADGNLEIRPERMAEVRRQARLIDVDEARGDLAKYAVMEGMTRVDTLRDLLSEALERGLDVALD